MPLPDELRRVLHAVEVVAGAIRDALGQEIDAYPGARSPGQADPMNRAFRSVTAALVRDLRPDAADVTAVVSAVLHDTTERRLAAEGWGETEVRFLVALEAADRDDWLAFLLLSSRAPIEPLLAPDARDRR